MSNRTCIVHVGAPKTGTTALQAFLTENQDGLKKAGYLYPASIRRALGHHDIAFLTGGGYPEWATPQELDLNALVEKLKAELNRWHGSVVISSENFYLLSKPSVVRRVLTESGINESFDTKIVVYVRRQDEAHVSWFNQLVKAQGFHGTLEESIAGNHGLWEYDRKIQEWAGEFTQSNVVVRSCDHRKRADVRRDFLEILGVPETSFAWNDYRANDRINRDILEFQRYVNRLPLKPQEKRRFHKQLIQLTIETANLGLFDDSPLLGAERKREILASYACGNSWVARTFFGCDQLFEDEKVVEHVETPMVESGLSIDKLSYIFGWILSRMERDVREPSTDGEIQQADENE